MLRLVSGRHGATDTNTISKLRCANGNAQHCKGRDFHQRCLVTPCISNTRAWQQVRKKDKDSYCIPSYFELENVSFLTYEAATLQKYVQSLNVADKLEPVSVTPTLHWHT